MNSCMCYQRSTRPWTVYILILPLSELPFLGLVGKAASTTICTRPPFGMDGIFPFGCFVLQVIPNFGYLIALDSHPCQIWRFTRGICSILEGTLLSQCLQNFSRGFRSCWKIFQLLLRNLAYLSHPISSGVSTIVSGSSTVLPLF